MDANVGDLVVCVDAALVGLFLREGAAYAVDAAYHEDGHDYYNLSGVALASSSRGFFQKRFRKIDHDKTEACDADFADCVKRSSVTA